MARYEKQIGTLRSSKTAINDVLTEKLADTVDVKLSGVADKIREIETIKTATLIIHGVRRTTTGQGRTPGSAPIKVNGETKNLDMEESQTATIQFNDIDLNTNEIIIDNPSPTYSVYRVSGDYTSRASELEKGVDDGSIPSVQVVSELLIYDSATDTVSLDIGVNEFTYLFDFNHDIY